MGVLGFQLVIIAIILVSGFISNKARNLVTFLLIVFTIIAVFTSWLMILQFVTILVANRISSAMSDGEFSSKSNTNQDTFTQYKPSTSKDYRDEKRTSIPTVSKKILAKKTHTNGGVLYNYYDSIEDLPDGYTPVVNREGNKDAIPGNPLLNMMLNDAFNQKKVSESYLDEELESKKIDDKYLEDSSSVNKDTDNREDVVSKIIEEEEIKEDKNVEYIADKSKTEKNYNTIKLVVFVLVVLSLSFLVAKQVYDKNSQEPDYSSKISELIKYEDSRDIDKILNCYSPIINRYWKLEHITKDDLKKNYKKYWKKVKYSKNTILSVSKLSEDSYLYVTKYDYLFRKKERSIITDIKIVFNKDGKIIEVFEYK